MHVGRYLVVLGFLLLFQGNVYSAIDTTFGRAAGHAIYLEAGGAAGYGSINYEKSILHHRDLTLHIRMGVGTFRIVDYTRDFNPDLLIPLSLHFLFGRDHHLEVGAGNTFSSIVHAENETFAPERDFGFHAHFFLGYRYQKKEGGILLRGGYTPLIESYRNFRHWAGISVGYAF